MSGDDLARDADAAVLSLHDAMEIGFKVAEMADRLKDVDAAMPGSQAVFGFELDDVAYEIIVKVKK
jgi:hypothetical protein